MSNSPDSSEIGRVPGRKSAKAPEKSNFANTCSLLGQFLKEKGTLGDLSLGMTSSLEGKGKPELLHQTAPTMNYFSNMETSGGFSGVPRRNGSASRNLQFMDLFPQHAGFGPSVSVAGVPKTSDFSVNIPSARMESETAQMTIFYAGQVIVLDDFPADKAREIMLLASKGSSLIPGCLTSTSGNDRINPGSLQRLPQPILSDLPIARRASLHRFLEKRKDRVSASAPYQISKSGATPSKQADSKTWLGLAPQLSPQVELQL
ncbi:hypothetical protein HHK36_021899 [Tetracentron sinense]|uniref:Protein TIFY n=1 Tax=Tetracentron sinense TaxID=13715 RepID=A0A834YW21_TETSI|nr:hypothetical protein HHK36_021899 [Tetracentron sinense]